MTCYMGHTKQPEQPYECYNLELKSINPQDISACASSFALAI